jgi:bifunctional polynucleotide phosphatase/kinase
MASFDFDWTLVNPKNGKTFPKDIDDWQWLYDSIPTKIKEYYDNNHMIVIFTNQSKDWKVDQILNVAQVLDIPLFVVIARDKNLYKPNIELFNKFIKKHSIDLDNSFFVGDALGRKSDFSDSDKVFAENIGIKCYSPEQIFYDNSFELNVDIKPSSEPEIIILMGYPGSGKTTIANNIFEDYEIIHGDIYKTTSKMLKVAETFIKNKKSIVFDSTNSSIKKRKEYIDFAKKHKYLIRCVHVNTSLDISYKRNKSRPEDQQVPKIAYSVYTKYYEEPTENEGFKLIII